MVRYCGTSIIYHNSILQKFIGDANGVNENSSQETLLQNFTHDFIYKILGDHVEGYHISKSKHWNPKAIPFLAICWVVENGENHSASENDNQNTISGIPFTKKMCAQFGLPDTYANSKASTLQQKIRELLSFKKSHSQWILSKILKRNIY